MDLCVQCEHEGTREHTGGLSPCAPQRKCVTRVSFHRLTTKKGGSADADLEWKAAPNPSCNDEVPAVEPRLSVKRRDHLDDILSQECLLLVLCPEPARGPPGGEQPRSIEAEEKLTGFCSIFLQCAEPIETHLAEASTQPDSLLRESVSQD